MFYSEKSKKEYSLTDQRWRGDDGEILRIKFEAKIFPEKCLNRKPNLWRYREAIPIVHDQHIVSFDEGFTPLIPVKISGKVVLIKQDQLFTTGSYKDRGASVLMSKAKELGIAKVVQDSSGNAGCAVAAYAAKAKIACEIFVPSNTSPGKLAQIEMYGAKLNKVPGSREDTAKAAFKAASENYYASHCWNPFFFQGTKTIAYEICEQLAWKAPDAIVVPAGNGTLVIGAFIGFSDLIANNIISKMPKIIAIQAELCAPLLSLAEGKTFINKGADTLAEGIAIATPIRANEIIECVNNSGGQFISVTENEILVSLKEMTQQGYYIEPTSAATIAGVSKYLSGCESTALIVSLFTGNGLKSTEKILKLL